MNNDSNENLSKSSTLLSLLIISYARKYFVSTYNRIDDNLFKEKKKKMKELTLFAPTFHPNHRHALSSQKSGERKSSKQE